MATIDQSVPGGDAVDLSRAARRFWEAVIVAAILLVVLASIVVALVSDEGMHRVRDFGVAEGALIAHLTGIFVMLKGMGHRENMTMLKTDTK